MWRLLSKGERSRHMTHTPYLTFERLDVYRVAKEALAIAFANREGWRGLPGQVASQFERALVSMVLNIAEGAGRESRADQGRHYAIARGSANEAGAVLEIVAAYGAISVETHGGIRSRIVRVVRMLNAMIR
jgi:four helix bundle protein